MIFFEVDETYFKDKAQIQQLLRVTNAETSKIEAELNYQVCKDGLYQLEKKFSFSIPSRAVVSSTPKIENQQ
jgi:thiol:disulfide interchange protein DsbD